MKDDEQRTRDDGITLAHDSAGQVTGVCHGGLLRLGRVGPQGRKRLVSHVCVPMADRVGHQFMVFAL